MAKSSGQQLTEQTPDLISQLRASEERYLAFIRNSNEGIWRFEVEEPIPTNLSADRQIKLMYKHAYLAEANHAMAKMYGLDSVKEIIGARLGDFLIESDPDNIAYLTAFVESGYRLSGAESHELDAKGNDRYFLNSLVGIVEDGKLVRAWGTQADVTQQHRATEVLRQNEERLDLALKASNIGTWEWDIKNNELTWSRELKKIFGLKPTEKVTYEKYLSLIHPDDAPNMQRIVKSAMETGKPYAIEHRVIWPDGSTHWILGRGQALLKANKPVQMIGTSMNIDKRKEFEIELHESEERFRNLADTAPVFIWLSDTKNLGTYFNKPWLEFTGRTLEQELGFGWTESVHPDDLARAAAYCQDCFDARKEFTMEFRLRRHDGTYHWVLDHGIPRFAPDGKFLGYIGSCLDIDKRKKFEIELHESEKRFRNMADAAPVLIWMAGPDKQVTYFNKPWQDFTGRKLEQDLGEGWREDIHPDDLDRVIKVYYSAVDRKKPYVMEYRVRRYDGTYRWMLDKGVPRYSSEGEFLGFIGSLIEVDEMKTTRKRKEELEEINKKLEEQRLQLIELNQSKDEFISLASHQLRTPATGVKQYIGMLLEGYGGELSQTQISMLDTAYESNERQLRIIDDLLKVAHIDAGKVVLRRRKTDLVKLLNDIINEQSGKFKRRQQNVVFKPSSQKVTANIDAPRMRMVLENLIDNANKYTLSGKTITVNVTKNKTHVRISIKDEGVGIAKKDIPKLFQKFSRVGNPLSTLVGGTGLGLYWAEKIVSLHHGVITVDSKLHKGSTFTINIPVDPK
jgi:PAS domain S-box-containing protein